MIAHYGYGQNAVSDVMRELDYPTAPPRMWSSLAPAHFRHTSKEEHGVTSGSHLDVTPNFSPPHRQVIASNFHAHRSPPFRRLPNFNVTAQVTVCDGFCYDFDPQNRPCLPSLLRRDGSGTPQATPSLSGLPYTLRTATPAAENQESRQPTFALQARGPVESDSASLVTQSHQI